MKQPYANKTPTFRSEPRIIMQDGIGLRNGKLGESSSEIKRGATWKKQRVVQIVPAGENIPARVYLSHCSLIFPPNQACHRMLAQGMEVGDAYSTAIEQILAHPELSTWEYICTLEHDNVPPNDGLLRLIARMEANPEYDAISSLYWTKGEAGVPQIWGRPDLDPVENFRPCPPEPGKLIETYGIGMGFGLWRIKMFKDTRIEKPWFKTRAGKDGVGTQDLAFCRNARKFGHKFGVDCEVLTGHYENSTDTIW